MTELNDYKQETAQSFFYSPSTGGFYLLDIHGDAIPEDAVAISQEDHWALLEGQAEGKIIMPPDEEHDVPYLADPPPPTKEEATAQKLAEVMSAYDVAFASIEAAYPAKERETWPIQLEEARAVLANPDAQTPMLSVMVAARDKQETVAEFAASIIANNDAYRLLAGSLTGQQQGMYAAVTAMAVDPESTAADILAYPVTYTMPDGM